jgi:hypothetical protein
MDTLADDKIIKIAKEVANATLSSSNVADVLAAPTLDSTEAEAIEIMIVLNPGSLAAIVGPRSARAVSEMMRQLADAGEKRFAIVRFATKGDLEDATP